MKKIPTIFLRDFANNPQFVTTQWHSECEWVRDGEGRATLKHDGTSCLVRDGKLYKRREVKPGQNEPPDFESLGTDPETGKTVGWVPVSPDDPNDRWHREGFTGQSDGTYELMGPKVQGNRENLNKHHLLKHGGILLIDAPRTFDELRVYLDQNVIEGIVWHHPDGRMAKIKRRDFGFRW